MTARANVVLPAPRSPDRVTRSPGSSELAMSTASRWVACSSGKATEKLEVPNVVSNIAATASIQPISSRRSLGAMIEGEYAGHGGAASEGGFQRDGTTMQLDERAHQRKTQSRTTMARAERISFEPIESLVLYFGGNSG